MIEKIQAKLRDKFGRDFAYYATCTIYTTLMLSVMFILSVLFHNIIFAIISTIVINEIRKYSYGYHEHELLNCIIITNILFLIFGYISKGCPLWVSFLLCCFCIRDIYSKSPLQLNYKDKTIEWHRHKLKHTLFLTMLVCLSLLYFEQYYFVNCILQSIIMTDLLLFENID